MSANLAEKLNAAGQSRLAKTLESLDGAAKARLQAQLEQIDWEELPQLIKDYVLKKPETSIPSDLSPAPFFPLKPKDAAQAELYKKALAEGKRLLSEGKVAALTVAGGQGTRLGFDGPKGTFPISPVKHKTLFQIFAEGLKRASGKYGHQVHWLIMTSELNDKPTRDFFAKHSFFGLPKDSVCFFTQGTMPAIAYDGSLLLAERDSLALAPNGHGGTLLALKKSGCLDKLAKLGVEQISYFQVDNPLIPVVEPFFIGLHSIEKAEISAIMLPKTNPFEKLGNFCVSKDRLEIIEYSDMPNALAEKRNADGTLAFIAGSPAIHMLSRAFVERLTKNGRLDMPWHRADKKVAFIDNSGKLVTPEKANAVKLESFIFDALPLATKTMVLEGQREELFAPTKNPTGVDSVESCRAMLVARDARRLELAGVKIPRKADGTPDCLVEISPLIALDDEDAASRLKGRQTPTAGAEAYYE